MNIKSRFLFVCVFCLLVAVGCASTKSFGDAKVAFTAGVWKAETLNLPEFSIGLLEEVIFKVRGLPQPVYPDLISLVVPWSECRDENFDIPVGQPWRNVVMEVELFSEDGVLVFSHSLHINDWNGAAKPVKYDKCELLFDIPFNPNSISHSVSPGDYSGFPPPLNNYDVMVKIIKPSLRQEDTVRFFSIFRVEAFEQQNHQR